jgi:hypothetical protein
MRSISFQFRLAHAGRPQEFERLYVERVGGSNLRRLCRTARAGFVDLPISPASRYVNVTKREGTRGMPRWGDFLGLRNHNRLDRLFIASGFTHEPDPSDPSTTVSILRYVLFGDEEG